MRSRRLLEGGTDLNTSIFNLMLSKFQPRFLKSVRAMTSIATLQRLSAKALSEKVLAEKAVADPTYAVIDVRDDGSCIPLCSRSVILTHVC